MTSTGDKEPTSNKPNGPKKNKKGHVVDPARSARQKIARKMRYPWIKWQAEFTASDEDAVPTLESFFVKLGVPKNTYLKHTSGWHLKRIEHHQKIAQEALLKFRRQSVKTILRQAKQAQVASALAFREIIGQDESGAAVLKIKMTPAQLIRLYESGSRNEDRTITRTSSLIRADKIENPPSPPPPPLDMDLGPAPATELVPVQDRAADERAKLQSILKDPKARDAAEKYLQAIDRAVAKEGRDGKK